MQIIDVINKVAGKVPGCSEPEIVSAYRDALIDFCTRTRCMSSWVTTTSDDLVNPAITTDQQTVEIVDALLNDEEIDCVYVNDREVVRATPEDPVLTWTDPNIPQIVPQPATALPLQMLLVFAPGPTASTVDDLIYMKHSEALNHGALARLLVEAGCPYSNPQVAVFHDNKFEAAITKAAALYGSRMRIRAHKLKTRPAPI